jgi:hypothetical protein
MRVGEHFFKSFENHGFYVYSFLRFVNSLFFVGLCLVSVLYSESYDL